MRPSRYVGGNHDQFGVSGNVGDAGAVKLVEQRVQDGGGDLMYRLKLIRMQKMSVNIKGHILILKNIQIILI